MTDDEALADTKLQVILVDELQPEDVIVVKLPPRPNMSQEERQKHEQYLSGYLKRLFPRNQHTILPGEVSLEIKRGAA